jgi:hypothetical protein
MMAVDVQPGFAPKSRVAANASADANFVRCTMIRSLMDDSDDEETDDDDYEDDEDETLFNRASGSGEYMEG